MEEVKKVPDEETGGGRQNTMKILDKREEVWEEKKKSDGWNGYHVLFTETTQFLIIWEDMKKKLKIAYFATLAFLILFVVCLGGAGIWNFIESALLSAVVPIIYGLFCRDDIYLKVFDPARDQGALYLPEEMTWEEAVDVIRRGFAAPEVEQITDTADTVVFHSKKYGAYQVQNTENGLKLGILSVPSKKEENKSRYYLFGNMIYSQIISLLYPEMLSAVQVEQEKKAVHGYLKQKKIINLVATIAVIVVIAAVASGGFNMDSIKSCGLSDSQMPSIFSADATLDEIFDTYFDDSKWDNYKEDGKKIVTYTGDRVVESGRTLRFTFYFVVNSDDTFNLDHVTSNGTELDWLQEMIILNMLNEYYLGMNKTTSTSVATRVESEVAVSDNTVWNDSENSTSDYTEEDSDDEYAYISGADKVIDEVCGTVWGGWENDDPDHPELDEITYGMVMDYLFEDSTYYSWYYDDTTGNVIMEGTYTTFDYTMGMADEPTACDVKLTFTVDNDGNWFVSDYSGDEFDTADEFLQVAYDFYYEGNRLL